MEMEHNMDDKNCLCVFNWAFIYYTVFSETRSWKFKVGFVLF